MKNLKPAYLLTYLLLVSCKDRTEITPHNISNSNHYSSARIQASDIIDGEYEIGK